MVKGCHTYLDKQWFLVIEMEKRERARARVVYIISDYKRFPCHINNMNVLFKQKMCFWVELNSDPPPFPHGAPTNSPLSSGIRNSSGPLNLSTTTGGRHVEQS